MELALIIVILGAIGVTVVMALMRRTRPTSDAIEGSKPRAATPPTTAVQPDPVDQATAAAIGLALTLETTVSSHEPSGPSAWALAGRLQALNRRPR